VTPEPSTSVRPPGDRDSSRDERWYLADQEEFLRRSLEDARHEHEAGDLSDEDYEVLVARDSARLAQVQAEIEGLGPPEAEAAASADDRAGGVEDTGRAEDDEEGTPTRRPMAMWRKVGIAASCLLIVLGVVILVVHFVQARQPGEASSGSISVSQAQQIEQQLAIADSLNNASGAKNAQAALEIYNQVLGEDPSNPAALAGAGWLTWNLGTTAHVAGYVEDGRAEVKRSIKVSPTYYQGHLYYGLILANQDHNNALAVVQFDEFLADDPPSNELAVVAPEVDPSYQAIGKPVPAALAAPSPATSTTIKPSAP
jgi:tetratricopeptide (TPR) repeat protein